jgi:HK97 family phage prohead protease
VITFDDDKKIHVRRAPVAGIDVETGTVEALLMTYETEVMLEPGLSEVFTRGALDGAIANPRRVVVSNQLHDRGTTIGRLNELHRSGDKLLGTLKISDTTAGRDVLTLLRDEVLTHLSVEFRMKKGQSLLTHRGPGDTLVRHNQAVLVGISPVPEGAYGDASKVLSVRAAEIDRTRDKVLAELRALRAGEKA